mmetsp:Transcript_26973/g.25829  ORF Transcript_26973/g.25829 Transcript_26973/m.25829 type:complete len:441 (+) Transcript_26973:101-1423(+)
MPSKYDKLKASEIKDKLKKIGMSQAGDKGTQIYRLDLFDKCQAKELTVDGDINPCLLKGNDLKKCASKLGISPMLLPDEILAELITILEASGSKKQKKDDEGSSSSSSATEQSGGGGGIDGVSIAKKVLELSETDDYEAILNIATPAGAARISKQTPLAIMRKAYLKLSLIIHPDKLGRSFDQATKAFQALVSAFDRLSSPDIEEEVETKGKKGEKVMKIARSNDGCYRTRVCCPRCKQPWSEGTLDGNPDYFYNFLMTGIKQFTCSTCLCEFGCMTAIHKCHYCAKPFEYSPLDFHRKISCGREKCEKKFGFFMYSTSDRVMVEIKKEIKMEQERRLKARESKQSRAKRMDSRGRGGVDQDKAFLLGLLDCCPRCGETFENYPDNDQRLHLMECTDENGKQAEYKLKLKKENEKKEKKREKRKRTRRCSNFSFLAIAWF